MDRVAYTPVILVGVREICKMFRIGRERLYEWVDAGAPISAIRKNGRTYYSCEVMRLSQWLEKYSK